MRLDAQAPTAVMRGLRHAHEADVIRAQRLAQLRILQHAAYAVGGGQHGRDQCRAMGSQRVRQACRERVLGDAARGQRRIGPQPLAQGIHATEGRGRGDAEAERIGHELGQWTRKAGQGPQGSIGKELGLQRRAEQRIVLEQPVQVLEPRSTDVLVAQTRQPPQSTGFKVVRQRCDDVGDHARSEFAYAG